VGGVKDDTLVSHLSRNDGNICGDWYRSLDVGWEYLNLMLNILILKYL
jgi:hypothetical protein